MPLTPLDRSECHEKRDPDTLPEREEQNALDAQEFGCKDAYSVVG
jgi:hypothetical protein